MIDCVGYKLSYWMLGLIIIRVFYFNKLSDFLSLWESNSNLASENVLEKPDS